MTKTYLGVKNGQLSECPDSPNCVSTQTKDSSKRMEPLPFIEDLPHSHTIIKSILSEESRVKLETVTEDYIHAVFVSKLFRFKDDVEFYFDRDNQVIHFRSASRVGYSDFGVNRKRMDTIGQKYKEKEGGANGV